VFRSHLPPDTILVFLTGFMGAGKTTIGRALADLLGWEFIDLDQRVESEQGRKIYEIFSEVGEARFREMETAALKAALAEIKPNTKWVIALGGGTWTGERNAFIFACEQASSVFLDAPVEELWQRCQKYEKLRPLAAAQNHFRQLYEARRRRYMEAGLHVSTSGKKALAVAAEIAARLGLTVPGKDQSQ
jgi:shikimate kinase